MHRQHGVEQVRQPDALRLGDEAEEGPVGRKRPCLAGGLAHGLGDLAGELGLTVEADVGIIFEVPPEERLPAAMQLLGIDFTNLSDVAGHA